MSYTYPGKHRGTWTASASYRPRDTVIYDGALYRALVPHTAGGSFSSDAAKWDQQSVTLDQVQEVAIPFSIFADEREGKPIVSDPYTDTGVRVRYQGPRGGRVSVIGTSIEVGATGDQDLSFAVGRWSNSSWFTHLCVNSGGVLDMIYNGALGGDTVGGIGELMADFPTGSTHLDIRLTKGPPGTGPFNLESVFTDVGGPAQEGWYVTGWERITDYDPNPDYPDAACTRIIFDYWDTPTIKDHFKGDVVGWGMIGRFNRDIPDGVDICFIGGPINNVSKPDWTPENCAIGQQILADMAMDRGMFPIMCTITPGFTDFDNRDAVNVAVRNSHRLHGHASCDFYPHVVNPVTRGIMPNLTTDGLHYNQEGAEILAQAMMNEVIDKLEFNKEQRRLATADDDSINMLPNSTFTAGDNGESPSGTYAPTGWEVHEFFSDDISQIIVPSRLLDNVRGNLIRIAADGGRGTRGIKVSLDPSDFAEGDEIYMKIFARFYGFFADTTGDSYCKATAALGIGGTDGAVSLPVFYTWMRDYDGGVFSARHTIPDNVGTITSATFSITVGCPPLLEGAGTDYGYGIVEAGLPYLVNLTSQEIL